ncbi:hypothetical protein Trydic_g7823 [Trypoxylus dichotomus]
MIKTAYRDAVWLSAQVSRRYKVSMIKNTIRRAVAKELDTQQLLDRLTIEPNFMHRVVTGDESWVFECNLETKQQSAEWHTPPSPQPKKARTSKSMLIIFFLFS